MKHYPLLAAVLLQALSCLLLVKIRQKFLHFRSSSGLAKFKSTYREMLRDLAQSGGAVLQSSCDMLFGLQNILNACHFSTRKIVLTDACDIQNTTNFKC